MADLSASAGLSRFAHLMAKSAPADDEKDEKDAARAAADDDDDKALDDEKDDEKDDEGDDEGDEGDDDEGDKKKVKTGKKAKARPAASARLQERARCAAIFAAPGAANNTPLAAELAFNTSLPASAAIALLAVAPAGKRSSSGLIDRMASVPAIKVGMDNFANDGNRTAADEATALASGILTLARKNGAKF